METNSSLLLAAEYIGKKIDEAIISNAFHTFIPRNYLGASSIGESCLRKIQYQYEAVTPDDDKMLTARQLRIFKRGYIFEEVIAKWIKDAGFDLRTINALGKPYGFLQAKGKIRGHADGVILSGPPSLNYPMLWECKALGSKSWKEIVKHKMAKAKPVYATQIALYQTYLNLHHHPALFTALNADTMEIYVELIPYNAELSQQASDRALRVLQASEARELLPRISRDQTWYECSFCSWKNQCWKKDV